MNGMDVVQGLAREKFRSRSDVTMAPIDDTAWGRMQHLFDCSDSADPYQRSAAYFAMTGRNGAWLVQKGAAAVVVCRHPNLDSEFLAFPAIGEGGQELLAQTMAVIARAGGRISLARSEDKPDQVMPGYRLQRVDERVLDWTYPVHTLDVAAVSSHRGRRFQQLRTEIHKLDRSQLSVIDLEPAKYRRAVLDVVDQWSGGDTAVAAPYLRLLDLFDHLPLHGRMIFEGGRPAGFSIWEETSPLDGFANAYAHLGRA